MTCLPANMPSSANAPIARPSFQSTCPYSLRLSAPTRALGNLWQMFEATATMPGAPMVIIAGVSTKAPPEPMKPLTMPPIRPTRNSCSALAVSIWMKVTASMRARLLLPALLVGGLEPDRVPEGAGERPVHEREQECDHNRHQEPDLFALAGEPGELHRLVGVEEQQRIERETCRAVQHRLCEE